MRLKNGFTLLESAFAIAILSIAALAVTYLISNSSNLNTKHKSQSCMDVTNAAIELLRSSGESGVFDYTNLKDKNSFHYDGPLETSLSPAAVSVRRNLSDPYTTSGNTHLNMLSTMRLTSMSSIDLIYNVFRKSGFDVCRTPQRADWLKPTIQQMSHFVSKNDLFIQIQLFSLVTQKIDCSVSVSYTRPKGTDPSPSYMVSKARADIGYQVTVYMKENAQSEASLVSGGWECSSTQKFISTPENSLLGAPTPAPIQFAPNYACSATAYTAGAAFSFVKSRPVNAFICNVQIDDQNTPILGTRNGVSAGTAYAELCDPKYGCKSLLPNFTTRSATSTQSTSPAWFDCRELNSKVKACLNEVTDEVKLTYDTTTRAFNIQFQSLKERCAVYLQVAETDSALQVSRNSNITEIKNLGRDPGNFSCSCDGNKKVWVCSGGLTQANCPSIGVHPAAPATEAYVPGAVSACDCYPNSCACATYAIANPGICGGAPPSCNTCGCAAYAFLHTAECSPGAPKACNTCKCPQFRADNRDVCDSGGPIDDPDKCFNCSCPAYAASHTCGKPTCSKTCGNGQRLDSASCTCRASASCSKSCASGETLDPDTCTLSTGSTTCALTPVSSTKLCTDWSYLEVACVTPVDTTTCKYGAETCQPCPKNECNDCQKSIGNSCDSDPDPARCRINKCNPVCHGTGS